MSKHYITVIVLVGLLTALVLTGTTCLAAASKTVIRYMEIPGAHESTSHRIVDIFNEEHSDIEIVYEPTGGNYQDKVTLRIASGTVDIFWAGVSIPEFAEAGLLLPLQSFLEAEPETIQDMLEGFIEDSTYEGQLWAIPKDGSALNIYYNKCLFDKAGLVVPDPEWDWDSFLAYARKLTKRSAADSFAQLGYHFTEGWTYPMGAWILSNGGSFLDGNGEKCVLDKPEAIEALDFIRSLLHEHEVASISMPSLSFYNGNIGMMTSGFWNWQALNSNDNVTEWDVARLPRGKAGSISPIWGEGFAIAATTDHPREAWEAIKFLAGKEAQLIRAADRQSLPSLLPVLQSETLFPYDGMYNYDAWVYSALNSRLLTWGREPNRCQQIISGELWPVWAGEESVRNAVARIKDQIDAIYSK